MTNQRFGCAGIALAVILCISLLLNFVFIIGSGSGVVMDEPPKFEESTVVAAVAAKDGKESKDKIALITLRGIISGMEPGSIGDTMVDDLKIQLQQAVNDEKVKAVVLLIDSPGGEVTASDNIYSAVKSVRDKSKKPVVVHMGAMAASGGYYVACGASHIIANETTFTGSIGVIMQGLNYQELLGKVGVQFNTFKSGKMKDMLSGSRAMTDEEREYIQAMIMQTYGKFVGIVAKERGLPEDQLRSGLADGRVISGKDAFDAKLVNQLGGIEDAYAKAMELGKAPGARIIRYDSPMGIGRLLKMLGKSEGTKIEVKLADGLAPKLEAGRLYYLPSLFAQ